jgi:putative SOS response-associated peptidase YedK
VAASVRWGVNGTDADRAEDRAWWPTRLTMRSSSSHTHRRSRAIRCIQPAASRADLLERFVVDDGNADELRGQDFNVTPTKDNPVVIARIPDDAGEAADPVRELRAFRWGLLPVFAKDVKDGARMINARAETVHQKPAYRRAFKSERALIPVDAFYEWLETDEIGRSGKKLKQPFAIRPADGSTLGLAGLYEVWYDKSLPDDDPNRVIPTYTIITTRRPTASAGSTTGCRWRSPRSCGPSGSIPATTTSTSSGL